MTPEYLEELADLADPDQLWRLGALEHINLPPDKRRQLDTGIGLRRQAHHVRQLAALLESQQSLLITPLLRGCTATMAVETPPEHQKLRQARESGVRHGP